MEEGEIDWSARDGLDATLPGFAVKRVRDDYQGNPPVESVRILLRHGAPLTDSAARPDELLMDPNAKDSFGLPLIHTTSCNLSKLKLLDGADLSAPGNCSDRPQWTPLMNAIYMREWEEAVYLIEKNVSTLYRAPDDNTVASVSMDCVKRNGLAKNPEPGYTKLVATLNQKNDK